jgi:uncharacterized membrane protein
VRTGYFKGAMLLVLSFAIVVLAISLPHYVASAAPSQAYGISIEGRDFSGSPSAQSWDASVTATFIGGDDGAVFSVRPDATSGFDTAYDIPEPPAPPKPYVRAYFYYPGQALDELHRSCLPPENLMEWPLRIEYADNTMDITLTWSVGDIPTEYTVLLYRGGDLVADMRAKNNYTFEASSGDHDFRIVVRLPEVGLPQPPKPSLGVNVSISPRQQDGAWRETLKYVVTVTNTGNVADTYSLTVTDNASPSWGPTVSPGSLTVSPGGTGTATLSVTIPENVPVYTVDNMRVTATGTGVSDSDSCTAHVIQAGLRVVRISITPENQSGAPGAALQYRVDVTNGSDQGHVFDLRISGGTGWKPRVSPGSLTLAAGASGTATLSVTVPGGVIGGSSVGICVTATSRADPTLSASASCIARVAVVPGVKVSISPDEDSGSPGTALKYTFTVTNIGNVVDTYDLAVTDTAGWNLELSSSPLTISMGSSENTVLNVTIPENAEPGAADDITITAISRVDPTVSGSASCRAIATAPSVLPLAIPLITTAIIIVLIGGYLLLKRRGIRRRRQILYALLHNHMRRL